MITKDSRGNFTGASSKFLDQVYDVDIGETYALFARKLFSPYAGMQLSLLLGRLHGGD